MSAEPATSWWSRVVRRFRLLRFRLSSTPSPEAVADPTFAELSTFGESPLTVPGPDPRRADVPFPNSRCPRPHTPRRPTVQSIDLEAEVAARIDAWVDAGAVDEAGLHALEGYLEAVLAQQTARLESQFTQVGASYLHLQAQLERDIAQTTVRIGRLERDIRDLDRSYVSARDRLLGAPRTVGWSGRQAHRGAAIGDRLTQYPKRPPEESSLPDPSFDLTSILTSDVTSIPTPTTATATADPH